MHWVKIREVLTSQRDYCKDIHIKQTVHIAKLNENVDPGNDKIVEEENEPNTAGKQENNDNTSEEVKDEVKLLKVHNTTLDPDEKEPSSPY